LNNLRFDYESAIEYLLETGGQKKLKHPLHHIIEICKTFSSPQEKLKVIHIAGTNGKGSSCAMLSSILNRAGYKTGVFTSPHLIRFNERITIGGAEISDRDFAKLLSRVVAAHSEYKAQAQAAGCALPPRLSFFETLTVMAFIYFYEQAADYAIIETGLGGRLDSTNIITKPILSIITRIGYDHCDILGDTITSIASEKAGIIKKNCPAVLYLNTKEVYNVIREVAQNLNSALYYNADIKIGITREDITGTVFSARSDYFTYDDIRLNLFGRYQVENACGVLLAVRALNDTGADIEPAFVSDGLAGAVWPCRAEVIASDPLVLIDGAHNINGANALCETLAYFKNKRIILVIGMLSDKPCMEFLSVVSKLAYCLIITKPEGKKAAWPVDFSAPNPGTEVLFIEDYKAAIDTARRMATDGCVICVTGSLYLSGAVWRYMKGA